LSLTPSLTDSNNWVLAYSTQKAAAQDATGAYFPISTISVPILLDSFFLAIRTDSQEKKATWKYGGSAAYYLPTGIGIGGVTESRFGEVRYLSLGEFTLCSVPKLANEFELRIFPPYYFRDISVSVWMYTGAGEPTIEGKLDKIYDAII
jgi:hypothetical protein